MSIDLFDLGQRLRAAADGRPVPAALYAPALPPTRPIAVAAHADGTIAATDGTHTLTGDVLAALGVSTDDPVHRTLVPPTRAAWTALNTATRITRTATTSTGTVTDVHIDTAGHLMLDLADVTTGQHPFTIGDTITVRPRATDPHQQRSARTNLARRYRAHNNWLGRDTPPPTRRRTFPLDVVIAAADD